MATTATTRTEQATALTPTLWLAVELAVGQWTLGLTTGIAPRPRERRVTAGGECAGAEDGPRSAGPEVAERTLAVARDGGAAEGRLAEGGGAEPMSQGAEVKAVAAAGEIDAALVRGARGAAGFARRPDGEMGRLAEALHRPPRGDHGMG